MSEADSAMAAAPSAPWPELDRSFLQGDRRAAPPFPLEVFPDPWRPWIEGHAQSSSCTDYTAHGLLAAVSAVCGSRFVVDVTPHWREPLVLWQALVGAPSTGKTPALVAARRLLAGIKAPPDTLVSEQKPRAGVPELTPWRYHRGMASWYEDLDLWLVGLSRDRKERMCAISDWTGDASHSDEEPLDLGKPPLRFPESIFGTVQADRLDEALGEIDDVLLSRLLYCWPVPRLEARLDGANGDTASAHALIQRLVDLPGTIEEPSALALHEEAADRLQALVPQLRTFMRDTDGVEAAWIGKGAGTIVRLAGLLCLMDWAAGDAKEACTTVEEPHLARAHALWADYFWPHAQAVFGQAPRTIADRRVRRVGRWLQRMRAETVSREEVRREALGNTVNADTAEDVIERLERHGLLRMLTPQTGRSGGRPRRRWEVNPELWEG
jgi:hypothetical protein